MSVYKYAKFISEQQKSMVNAGLANPGGAAQISEQFNLNEVAAIMKHFRGEDQRHGDGSAQSAMNNHEKIMNHLHKTLGPKHPVYKKIESSLNKAQKQHAIADHHPYTDKFFRHKEYASGHEDAAKEAYADHLKSSKKVDEAVIDALAEGDSRINENVGFDTENYVDMLHMYIEELEGHFETEALQQIQELSKKTLRSYRSKRAAQRADAKDELEYHFDAEFLKRAPRMSSDSPEDREKAYAYHNALTKDINKMSTGIKRASAKIRK
jgi:hypothetical protein